MNSTPQTWEKQAAIWLQHHSWVLPALLCLVICASYANALTVSFTLDDLTSIIRNPAIREFPDPRPIWQSEPMRFVTYWTFALNFSWTGLDPWSYHLINVVLHAWVTLMVWWLVRSCFLLAYPQSNSGSDSAAIWLPLVVALLFAAHPLQTQAVTYVVQRAALLAALFYLGAMAAYLQARLARSPLVGLRWGGLALLLFVLGMLSKQNVATLPLALLLLEFTLLRGRGQRYWLPASILLTVMAGVGLATLWLMKGSIDVVSLDALTTETAQVARLTYLATQMEVLWRYVGLTLWPAGQHLEHDIPFVANITAPHVLAAALGHVALMGMAILLASSARYRLTGLGLLFFYVAHGVESSVIPISDPMFEHRMYLPLFGLALAFASLLFLPAPAGQASGAVWQVRYRTPIIAAIALCVTALAVTTVQRNQVWQSLLELYRRDAENARFNPRPVGSYGSLLVESGQYEAGLKWLRKAMQMRNGELYPYEITHVVYGLHHTGDLAKARRIVDVTLNSGRYLTPHQRMVLLLQQSGLAFDSQEYDEALRAVESALSLFPRDPEAQRLREKIICRKAGGVDCPP